MIISFKSRALRLFAETGNPKKLPVQQVDRVRRILALLDAAKHPRELDQPGLFFHMLKQRVERFSVRVSGNYRITWSWKGVDAIDVDLEDYH